MQNKAALGKRYTCFKCGCKFYDLNKPEPVCPKCGVDQNEDPSPDPRVAVMSRYKASARPAAPARKVNPYDGDIDDEESDANSEDADDDEEGESDADEGDLDD